MFTVDNLVELLMPSESYALHIFKVNCKYLHRRVSNMYGKAKDSPACLVWPNVPCILEIPYFINV